MDKTYHVVYMDFFYHVLIADSILNNYAFFITPASHNSFDIQENVKLLSDQYLKVYHIFKDSILSNIVKK